MIIAEVLWVRLAVHRSSVCKQTYLAKLAGSHVYFRTA